MDEGINADPDKLDMLSDELSKTPVLLENVFRENAEMIVKTQERLHRTLDIRERALSAADMQLGQAEADLQYAYSDEYADISFYMSLVANAQARVNAMEYALQAVKRLNDEYQYSVECYKREEETSFQDYMSFFNKGKAILEKYAALVRASASAISEG